MTSKLRVRRLVSGLVSLGLAGLFAQNVSAQDVAITNARVIVGNGTVIGSGTVIVRAGKIVSVSAGAANTPGAQDDRREGHERHARIHRRASPHQHRPQREGADAGAARSRLHDDSVRRRPGGRQHHAPRSHRQGCDQRTARLFRPAACSCGTTRPRWPAPKSGRWPPWASSSPARSRSRRCRGRASRNSRFFARSWTRARRRASRCRCTPSARRRWWRASTPGCSCSSTSRTRTSSARRKGRSSPMRARRS